MQEDMAQFEEQEGAAILVSIFSPCVVIYPDLNVLAISNLTTNVMLAVWTLSQFMIGYFNPWAVWQSPPIFQCTTDRSMLEPMWRKDTNATYCHFKVVLLKKEIGDGVNLKLEELICELPNPRSLQLVTSLRDILLRGILASAACNTFTRAKVFSSNFPHLSPFIQPNFTLKLS